MKKFRPGDCNIPSVWCGVSNKIPKGGNGIRYTKAGSRYECLKQGFGAGLYSERKKGLPPNSIEQIKYIGPEHAKSFKKVNITTTTKLLSTLKKKRPDQIEILLKKTLRRSTGALDTRAYNSVLLYAYQHGIHSLPGCKRIR